MQTEFTQTPDEIIADTLSRYSVLDLREQSDADLDAAEAKYAKADNYIRVIKVGRTNLINWWQIESEGRRYEVRRYEHFVFCSCKSFFFTKKVCKHIFVTTKSFSHRQHKEMDLAPYLKDTSHSKPLTSIGKIRI